MCVCLLSKEFIKLDKAKLGLYIALTLKLILWARPQKHRPKGIFKMMINRLTFIYHLLAGSLFFL